MNTIQSVTPVPGVSKTTGKQFVRYDVVLDNGVQASGFDPVVVGEQVDVVQKGKYVNYLKIGGVLPPGSPTPTPPTVPFQQQPLDKNGYWEQKDQRDREWRAHQIAQQPRIERQHSQEMALRWFAIMGGVPGDPREWTTKLRAMIDWFERDINRSPNKDKDTDDDGPPI